MDALIRDLMAMNPELTPNRIILETVCPHGVVIGGIYQHFKGSKYKVMGFVRPASGWNGELHVRYVQINDVEHEPTRPLSEFLGDVEKPDYRGPRFRLVGVP